MSNFLAVDTSSKHLTVVAVKGEKEVVNFIPDCAMRHSVLLMDEIEKTLNEAQLSPAECDFFAAVTGPGSFTGIRIGISCVKGFATALNKQCLGVTAFDLIAYNVNSGAPYLAAIDAAHGYYYACGYTAEGAIDIQPCYISKDALIALNRPVYGFEELDLPCYSSVEISSHLAPAVKNCAKEGVCALYVRRSQAEEERIARSGGLR
ncbi:MAG: tRNA (adenosine(37)-N6)-threonylcarbamoyltransferase complex dimerization subunit type 1 TsaB [Candidatus Coproplasma sp.]